METPTLPTSPRASSAVRVVTGLRGKVKGEPIDQGLSLRQVAPVQAWLSVTAWHRSDPRRYASPTAGRAAPGAVRSGLLHHPIVGVDWLYARGPVV